MKERPPWVPPLPLDTLSPPFSFRQDTHRRGKKKWLSFYSRVCVHRAAFFSFKKKNVRFCRLKKLKIRNVQGEESSFL